MVEETPGEQGQTSLKEQPGIEGVTAYVEQKISHQQGLIQRREKGQVGPLLRPEDVQKVQAEIDRFRKMKDAVARGEYRGVAAELQKDITSEEQALEGWKKELNRELRNDDVYFRLKEKRMNGEEVLRKATDESSKTWIKGIINELNEQQGNTERGQVLRRMEETQARKDHLQALQKVVLTPPASPTAK